jgi:maleylacetoacetate isomerase
MILYSFFRSSAAWRVRIALHLKGLAYTIEPRNFRTNAQNDEAYLVLNPQGLVPALSIGGDVLTQSLPIIEYLDELQPAPPLLPTSIAARAKVRAMAAVIACDIHPIDNLRVLDYLRKTLGQDDSAVNAWYRHWVAEGLAALEALVRADNDGRHCQGDKVSLADICLVPQLYNARRFGCDLEPYPTLCAIDASLRTLAAFNETAPELQPDAI